MTADLLCSRPLAALLFLVVFFFTLFTHETLGLAISLVRRPGYRNHCPSRGCVLETAVSSLFGWLLSSRKMSEALLLAANAIADKKARQDRYAEILEQLLVNSDVEGLKCFVEQGECRKCSRRAKDSRSVSLCGIPCVIRRVNV